MHNDTSKTNKKIKELLNVVKVVTTVHEVLHLNKFLCT